MALAFFTSMRRPRHHQWHDFQWLLTLGLTVRLLSWDQNHCNTNITRGLLQGWPGTSQRRESILVADGGRRLLNHVGAFLNAFWNTYVVHDLPETANERCNTDLSCQGV